MKTKVKDMKTTPLKQDFLKYLVFQSYLTLCTLPEHLRSAQVFSGVRVTRSLVFMCMF